MHHGTEEFKEVSKLGPTYAERSEPFRQLMDKIPVWPIICRVQMILCEIRFL